MLAHDARGEIASFRGERLVHSPILAAQITQGYLEAAPPAPGRIACGALCCNFGDPARVTGKPYDMVTSLCQHRWRVQHRDVSRAILGTVVMRDATDIIAWHGMDMAAC